MKTPTEASTRSKAAFESCGVCHSLTCVTLSCVYWCQWEAPLQWAEVSSISELIMDNPPQIIQHADSLNPPSVLFQPLSPALGLVFSLLKKPILLIYLFIFHWVWSSVPGLEQGLETNPRACLPLHACCVHFQKTLLKSAWNQNGPYLLFLMHIPGLIVKDLSMLVFILKTGFSIAQIVEYVASNTKVMGSIPWEYRNWLHTVMQWFYHFW